MLVEPKESVSGGGQHKGGNGKPRIGTSKGAASLEQGDQAAVLEPQPQPALASSQDLASFETLGRSPHLDPKGWSRWTYDTGAAILAFPRDATMFIEREASECSYKTASGQGTTEYGYGVTSVAGLHRSTKL